MSLSRNAFLFVIFSLTASCQRQDATDVRSLLLTEMEPGREYSGEWVDRNGSRLCDGYLTRREDEDFCVAEVPNDWRPFEFDGKTYHVQPLSKGHDQ